MNYLINTLFTAVRSTIACNADPFGDTTPAIGAHEFALQQKYKHL